MADTPAATKGYDASPANWKRSYVPMTGWPACGGDEFLVLCHCPGQNLVTLMNRARHQLAMIPDGDEAAEGRRRGEGARRRA